MSPAFTEKSVLAMSELFLGKAQAMVQQLAEEVQTIKDVELTNYMSRFVQLSSMFSANACLISVWGAPCWSFGRAALDILGVAGFGYEFNALTSKYGSSAPLYEAFRNLVFQPLQQGAFAQFHIALQTYFPNLFKLVPFKISRSMATRMAAMQREGRKVVHARLQELTDPSADSTDILSRLRTQICSF